jgi:hypothetical protein
MKSYPPRQRTEPEDAYLANHPDWWVRNRDWLWALAAAIVIVCAIVGLATIAELLGPGDIPPR